MSTIYSPLKVFHHQDRLDILRQGKQPVPCQVQLIISDLCQQSCSFCLVQGTMIRTPSGEVPVESIKVGDTVSAPDGGVNVVTETSKRRIGNYFICEAGDRKICLTGEHPILTELGFKNAEDIKVGDSAVVRMRVWSESDMERKEENMAQVYFPSCTFDEGNELLQKIQTASYCKRIFSSSPMSMRMQQSCKSLLSWSQKILGRLFKEPSSSWKENAQRRVSFKAVTENEEKESNEGFKSDSQGCCKDERYKTQERSLLEVKCGQSCKEENAFFRQSNEESSNSQTGSFQNSIKDRTVEVRNKVYELAISNGIGHNIHGQGEYLDRQTESRLQSTESKESYRVDNEGMLQWECCDSENSSEVWPEFNSSLQQQGMAVSSSVCTKKQLLRTGVAEDDKGLCIDGINLERSLVLERVTRIERVTEDTMVYNLSCDRIQAFEANGIIVHNCAYRKDGYSSNQLFTKDVQLASFGHNNPIRMIPYEKIVEILNDCVEMGIPAIQLTGGGEPTVHPQFDRIVGDILDRKLELALVTNGVNLKEKTIRKLTKAKWVRFSIDAGRKETYCKIREVGESHWNSVWDNIASLSVWRDYGFCNEGEEGVIVGVGFVVTKDNYMEIVECVDMAREVGADNIRISAVFQDEGEEYFDEFYQTAKSLCQSAKKLESSKFKVFDLFGERVEDLRQQSPDYHFCGIQHFVTYIAGDQNVYRCCVLAYNKQGNIGSIKDQRFKDLWESQSKVDNFANFDATKCPKCMFNSKNHVILYALEEKPEHVNYV